MKQLLILSGKGGTGKTTVASAFIKLSEAKAYADCDVDAPNLHLIMDWVSAPLTTDYYGLAKAVIEREQCINCDLCRVHCRFAAINAGEFYEVNPYDCEGCGVCKYICPADAIKMKPHIAGELALYSETAKVFSTAKLKIGSGNSGLLVTAVKQAMLAPEIDSELAIIDGSPGIGCPVIASLNGVDMVLIVAEPSVSGFSDMERIIRTARMFGLKIAVCINKFDVNIEITKEIESFCRVQNLPAIGRIPFDSAAVKALNDGQTIVDIDCAASTAVRSIYQSVLDLLFTECSVISNQDYFG
ncbi:MAG TPA: 4Fe-4S binding protein [Clostridiaceae bacterium]|nr:4Fe-4S binding protein [Clostridiaceae bacterium]